jgi:hypothetical protein
MRKSLPAIMSIRIYILLIAFLAVSCTPQKKKLELNFYEIDVSRSTGWNYFYSIHVDSTKQFIVKKDRNGEKSKYFKGILTDSLVEQIVTLVDSINVTKYDSVYKPNCMDCPIYKIIIESKTRKLTTSVRGDHSLYHLDSLVRIFTNISFLPNLELIDTTYDFKSFQNFLPPIAKDTNLID